MAISEPRGPFWSRWISLFTVLLTYSSLEFWKAYEAKLLLLLRLRAREKYWKYSFEGLTGKKTDIKEIAREKGTACRTLPSYILCREMKNTLLTWFSKGKNLLFYDHNVGPFLEFWFLGPLNHKPRKPGHHLAFSFLPPVCRVTVYVNPVPYPIAKRTHWNHKDWPSDLDSESFPSRALWMQPFLHGPFCIATHSH